MSGMASKSDAVVTYAYAITGHGLVRISSDLKIVEAPPGIRLAIMDIGDGPPHVLAILPSGWSVELTEPVIVDEDDDD